MPSAVYFRLLISSCHGGATSSVYQRVAELEMRSTSGGSNLCTGGTPIASSEYFPAARAFDGSIVANTNDWAGSPGSPAYIGYQFAGSTSVNFITVKNSDTANGAELNQHIEDFEIQSSNDGSSWSTLLAVVGHPITASASVEYDVSGVVSCYIEAPGPLGAAEALAAHLVTALGADAGVLGAPAVRGHSLFAYASDTGPLGAPSAKGHLLYASASDAGPLGAVSALGLHDFTVALGDAVTYYVMDLETPGGLVRVPISSWQATMQTDEMCYVQCVVPACTDWVEDLGDATEFVISRRVVLADDSSLEYEMARAPLQTLSLARGPTNYSATLSGYVDALTADDDPPAVYDRDLTGVRAIFTTGGNVRARSSIDWLLRPGHRAFAGETEIIVDFISYYVGGGDAYMDVGQRA